MNFSQLNHIIQKKVLFVCFGNIYCSPIAQGILKSKEIYACIDSATTSNYHMDDTPDSRSIEVCRQHDIDISHQRARQVTIQDIHSFDHIIAMDAPIFNFLMPL